MLRTLFVLAIIAVGIRYSFKSAFYTLLFYLWLAYFRPDYWLWSDFVSSLRLSFIVGATLLVSTLFAGERFRMGVGPLLLFAFLAHSLASTVLAAQPQYSFPYWQEFAKTIVVSYLMIVLVTTEQRLRLVLLVIALSLGFEGAKQGWAELVRRPGAMNANEWPMLGDNNGVAMGMLMLAPIWIALASTASQRWEKWMGYFFAGGVLYRAISTYSRGGFLATFALGMYYLARSKRKLAAGAAIVVLAAAVSLVLPQDFWDRMGTIQTAAAGSDDIDRSAAGRLHFWDVATVMASSNPVFGVGHNAYSRAYDRYDATYGEFGRSRAVHSSWFGILAELGYVGFALFVALVLRSLYLCSRVKRLAKDRPEATNLAAYAGAIQAGLLVFVVGGSFISVQYTELLWHTMALSMVIDGLATERLQPAESPVPVSSIALRPLTAPAQRISNEELGARHKLSPRSH